VHREQSGDRFDASPSIPFRRFRRRHRHRHGDARRGSQRRRFAHARQGTGCRLGLQDIADGTATTPSVVHQVFRPDGTFAGTETLIRADLFAGQPCPTDQWLPVPPWLPTPAYYACHHFEFTP